MFNLSSPSRQIHEQVPVLYWLSGLTCTHENFITKAGAQQFASELGLMIVVPDTSPRGAGIEGEDEFYDLGTGAGFFINATKEKWSAHYRMEDYIIHELPKSYRRTFSCQNKILRESLDIPWEDTVL